MKWVKGRLGTGYKKITLFKFKVWRLGFDCVIIKYPENSFIPEHIDRLEGNHYRLNIVLHRAESGGYLYLNGVRRDSRLILFRPDAVKHMVTKIRKGKRIVFSLGMAYFHAKTNS